MLLDSYDDIDLRIRGWMLKNHFGFDFWWTVWKEEKVRKYTNS